MSRYTGPAGLVLSRDDVFRLWLHTQHVNELSFSDVQQRMRVYLETPYAEVDSELVWVDGEWTLRKHSSNV